MALHIRNAEADRLARQLAQRTGESLTDAIVQSLRERLDRHPERARPTDLAAELLAIGRQCASLPQLDTRSADEILGYDDHGLPT
jgi:antitoxin VapB